jgi:hypothetical protein
LFVLPMIGLPGPLFAFALVAILVAAAIHWWLPDDRGQRLEGRGAAMSYPSLASMITGASVRAATAPERQKRLSWRDGAFGSGSSPEWSQAMRRRRPLTCNGFFITTC